VVKHEKSRLREVRDQSTRREKRKKRRETRLFVYGDVWFFPLLAHGTRRYA
jgi:hypothetical protein